ncbi:Fc.00g003180.m01.CDS01 [Cosmosporella sp. VM-42]
MFTNLYPDNEFCQPAFDDLPSVDNPPGLDITPLDYPTEWDDWVEEDMATTTNSTSNQDEKCFRLMDLPVEIRLEIYGWLHLVTPVRHAQLAAWYPTPHYRPYVLSPVFQTTVQIKTAEEEQEEREELEANFEAAKAMGMEIENIESLRPAALDPDFDAMRDLLSPFRPLGALPSALLRANKKIYHEARCIPFETNEFIFVNWFSSGLWAAKAFTQNIKPWQRTGLRYIRLEMMHSDFKDTKNWEGLCSGWADAVVGLRLKLDITGNNVDKKEEGFALSKAMRNRDMKTFLSHGLARISSLEKLELELKTAEMNNAEKVEWCEELQELLREEGLKVGVTCTEEVPVPFIFTLDPWKRKIIFERHGMDEMGEAVS